MLGLLLGSLLAATGVEASTSRLVLAFGLGFGVCFGLMVFFVKVAVPKPPDSKVDDKEHWWLRGEPPPWERDDEDKGKGPPR